MPRSLALVLLLTLTTACSSTRIEPCVAGSSIQPPRNFGRVEGAEIYRGGQPETCGELEYLKSMGVRSVLKLNDRGLAIDADEGEQVRAIGLAFESFAFDATTIGEAQTCPDVQRALQFLENRDNWPVYVHCTAGKDRTGYIIGLYERTVLGLPIAEVMENLHEFGHRGIRSIVMGQIDRELQRDPPVCAPR